MSSHLKALISSIPRYAQVLWPFSLLLLVLSLGACTKSASEIRSVGMELFFCENNIWTGDKFFRSWSICIVMCNVNFELFYVAIIFFKYMITPADLRFLWGFED
ncbi:uncharacterized protein LOC132608813 [Lycium barbarum]|uniref:uncharacterized protein LOC132608813 n=1 Tax=Lycium barbarum TaxID=112863 RepID=UPI00293EB81B|nr:uncharacterized protein LOC132608813 [Lycium barbarum]